MFNHKMKRTFKVSSAYVPPWCPCLIVRSIVHALARVTERSQLGGRSSIREHVRTPTPCKPSKNVPEEGIEVRLNRGQVAFFLQSIASRSELEGDSKIPGTDLEYF